MKPPRQSENHLPRRFSVKNRGIGGKATNKRMHKRVPMCPACGERKDRGICTKFIRLRASKGNITAPAIPTPQRKQDFAKFTFHEVLLFFLFFARFHPLFFARHFTSSMVRSHTLVPVGPVTIRPSVWRSRL